jgi:hypothetical protein
MQAMATQASSVQGLASSQVLSLDHSRQDES